MHWKNIFLIIVAFIVVIVMGCAGMDMEKKTGKVDAPLDTIPAPAAPGPPVKPSASGREATPGAEEAISKSDSMKTAYKGHIMKEFDGPVKNEE